MGFFGVHFVPRVVRSLSSFLLTIPAGGVRDERREDRTPLGGLRRDVSVARARRSERTGRWTERADPQHSLLWRILLSSSKFCTKRILSVKSSPSWVVWFGSSLSTFATHLSILLPTEAFGRWSGEDWEVNVGNRRLTITAASLHIRILCIPRVLAPHLIPLASVRSSPLTPATRNEWGTLRPERMTRKGVEVEKERVMSGIRKERPTGKRVIDEEGTDGDSCLKWYAGNPLSSHTHPVGDTREETVGNDRGGLRPVSPTGVEWVGSGTRPISSHSSRFLVSSLVPHSVPRNRLSFVEISPSQVKWRTEQTKDDPRQWKTVRGSGAVHVSLRSSHLRPFGPLFVSRSAPRAAPLPPAARKVRRDREWVSYA